MRQMSKLSNMYFIAKSLSFKKEIDLILISKFEKALKSLPPFERCFFANTYLGHKEEKRWKQYYSKSTYYRLDNDVCNKFNLAFNSSA